MSFKDMVASDNINVFMNTNEFAEVRTVILDGEIYDDVPMVISGISQSERNVTDSDHAEGLYLASVLLHCRIEDLGGNQPEQGVKMKISDADSPHFMRAFYVASSICEMGMLQVELEAIDE